MIEPDRSLIRHPATPAPMIHAVDAGIAVLADGCVAFRYRLRGDMARIRIPAEGPPERSDSLWEHTCFEAFAGLEGEPGYREFNFSPSGQWAVHDFGDYRSRLADPALAAPRIRTRATPGRLELEAVVPLSSLPFAPGGAAWEIGLSAVIEAADMPGDGLSHWALRHSSPRPDFHLRDGFALRQASLRRPSR
ncbi:MAG: DOMON-like domain-containing protein [Candidatus Accumulibacter sp.]|jgi:hypothetical protein|nr:DOMON-like domain-containing protein [Accumulibacter sp.]